MGRDRNVLGLSVEIWNSHLDVNFRLKKYILFKVKVCPITQVREAQILFVVSLIIFNRVSCVFIS